nr:MAG TPA: hypothetical protein [Caudoviricetes sp.]
MLATSKRSSQSATGAQRSLWTRIPKRAPRSLGTRIPKSRGGIR